MPKEDYDLELDLVSPSIYNNTHRRQDNTDTREASGTGTAKPASINGLKKEVMTSDGYTGMTPSTTVPETNINLSREELLKLLSVFEGELQARDEVIDILKSDRPNNPAITDRYGLSNMPLQALQRDAASLDATIKDHVAEQTTQNLQKINVHQKESCKKLKQALLAAEQVNQRLVVEVTEEKRKHQDYMIKSDDFVNLLEEERERLKVALQKEKQISESRELEISWKLRSNKDELAKLKSLSLVLVEERQQQVSEISDQKQQIADLERRLKEAEIKWKESELNINTEKEHAMQLENDLEGQTDQFFQSQEDFNTKLDEEREKNAQLEEKVASMSQQLKKLQSVQRNLQKTDDQLWRIHEKLEQEDEEHDLLLEEVELLRQRVKDMEEGEEIYTQAQEDSKDIRQKLEEEITLTRNLRSQLKTLQTQVKAQRDLEKSIEDTDFRFDELQLKFEFEKRKSNDMREHLQKMKARMTELDQYENIIQESEEKMKNMKEKITLLNGDKKCCDEQVKFLIDKNNQLKNEMKTEKDKVTEITEKLIGESKKMLKLREELSQQNRRYATMQDKLKGGEEKLKELSSNKQTQAEEANDRLRRQVIMLKTRLDQLEEETEAKAMKTSKTSLPKSMELVDVVQKLHETEQRCEQLSQELHIKTKLCENLKKKSVQENQSNNNCNSKLGSVAVAVTQTESNDILTTTVSKKKAKQSGITKVAVAKNMFGADSPILSSRKAASMPSQGTSLLTRSGKVGPTVFQVNSKKTTMAVSSKLQAEELRESKYLKGSPTTNTATSRMTRSVKIVAPVTEQVNEPRIQKPSTVPLATRNSKVAPVDCSPTKIHTETDDRVQSVAEETKLAKDVSSIKATTVKTTRQSRAGDQVIETSEEFEMRKAATPVAKVVPAGFTVPRKPAAATEVLKLTKKQHTSNSKITKITKDVQSGALVEELDEPQTQKNLTSKSLTSHKGNSKELNVTNQDSKISKHKAPLKHFRTFQAQKDFSELQRKWAAKLGK